VITITDGFYLLIYSSYRVLVMAQAPTGPLALPGPGTIVLKSEAVNVHAVHWGLVIGPGRGRGGLGPIMDTKNILDSAS